MKSRFVNCLDFIETLSSFSQQKKKKEKKKNSKEKQEREWSCVTKSHCKCADGNLKLVQRNNKKNEKK